MGSCVALHYLFLSTAFAACGAVLACAALARARPAFTKPLLGVAAAWGAGALVLTATALPAWQNNLTLYRAVLAAEPDSYTASFGLGAYIAQQGHLDEARIHLKRAIAIAGESPDGVLARINLAMTYELPPGGGERYGAGTNLERARIIYEKALALSPDSYIAHLSVGRVRMHLFDRAKQAGRQGAAERHAEAVVFHFGRVLELQPEIEGASQIEATRGDALASIGRKMAARDRYRAAATTAAELGDAREALAIDPEPDEAAQLRVDIERIDAAH